MVTTNLTVTNMWIIVRNGQKNVKQHISLCIRRRCTLLKIDVVRKCTWNIYKQWHAASK